MVSVLAVAAVVSIWWCSGVHMMHLMLLLRQLPPWRDLRWPWMENLTRALSAGWWWVYAAGTAAMLVLLLQQAAAGELPPAFATAALVTFWAATAATAATWPYVSTREREGTV